MHGVFLDTWMDCSGWVGGREGVAALIWNREDRAGEGRTCCRVDRREVM